MLKVLVTGGAGFLGRGILRDVRRGTRDWDVTVMSRDEAKHIKVRTMFPGTRIVRGDVTADIEWLARVFAGHDLVIHAGANKLIDIGEHHAWEVVRNNVVGSMHVAEAAMRAGVRRVVGISTDKAVQPVNIYGATKMVMERLFQEADGRGETEFTCARYGNVIGSTISVVLYFREQLEQGGKLKMTVPAMTRFYMGIDEAIGAVDTALACSRGSVVIPKMHAMTLTDMARIALGQAPETELPDARVEIVGPRAGEKINESLLHLQESVRVLPNYGGDNEAGLDGSTLYFELRPIGETHRLRPFEITSDNPPLGPMTFDRINDLIEDAKRV